jgi:MFS family permease
VFIVTGAPGLLLPLLLLTFREPARRGLLKVDPQGRSVAGERPSLGEVLRYVWLHKQFYSMHFVAMALLAMAGYAVSAWLPTALTRNYPVSAGQVGKVVGIGTIVMNTAGMILAGMICDRLTRRGWKDAPVVVALISACGISLLSCLPPIMPTVPMVWAAIFASGLTFNAYNGVGPMAVNQITPNQYRAQISAVYLFVVNILGLAAGPWAVPFLNGLLFHDAAHIRFSLILVVFLSAALSATLLALERPLYRQKQLEAARWQSVDAP